MEQYDTVPQSDFLAVGSSSEATLLEKVQRAISDSRTTSPSHNLHPSPEAKWAGTDHAEWWQLSRACADLLMNYQDYGRTLYTLPTDHRLRLFESTDNLIGHMYQIREGDTSPQGYQRIQDLTDLTHQVPRLVDKGWRRVATFMIECLRRAANDSERKLLKVCVRIQVTKRLHPYTDVETDGRRASAALQAYREAEDRGEAQAHVDAQLQDIPEDLLRWCRCLRSVSDGRTAPTEENPYEVLMSAMDGMAVEVGERWSIDIENAVDAEFHVRTISDPVARMRVLAARAQRRAELRSRWSTLSMIGPPSAASPATVDASSRDQNGLHIVTGNADRIARARSPYTRRVRRAFRSTTYIDAAGNRVWTPAIGRGTGNRVVLLAEHVYHLPSQGSSGQRATEHMDTVQHRNSDGETEAASDFSEDEGVSYFEILREHTP